MSNFFLRLLRVHQRVQVVLSFGQHRRPFRRQACLCSRAPDTGKTAEGTTIPSPFAVFVLVEVVAPVRLKTVLLSRLWSVGHAVSQ